MRANPNYPYTVISYCDEFPADGIAVETFPEAVEELCDHHGEEENGTTYIYNNHHQELFRLHADGLVVRYAQRTTENQLAAVAAALQSEGIKARYLSVH